MPTLSINDFSCLTEASFKVAPVNVIIGPQGSGKSVTTKLLYFFTDIYSNFIHFTESEDSLEKYKKHLCKSFAVWFPPSAWGSGRFNITYTSGPFTVRVLRRISRGQPTDDVSVTFSDWFSDLYRWSSTLHESSLDDGLDARNADELSANIDRIFVVRQAISKRIAKDLGDDYFSNQTFIPAGRAFFTSIGRLVAGIEQAGHLDPVTIKFARLFASLRDRRLFRSRAFIRRLGDEFNDRRRLFMNELFGGEVKFENELEYVQSNDGRKIPFSSLSSGQQELLPMWSIMDYLNERDAIRAMGRAPKERSAQRELIYIEEPEAHLFPTAQSVLMEFLIGSVASSRHGRRLILTTHSPYIMSKLNVFLKAGHLAKRKKRNHVINEVVPRDYWLTEQHLSAHAIEGGRMKNLIDEDCLIDARYLDNISEEISRDFSALLKIEFGSRYE